MGNNLTVKLIALFLLGISSLSMAQKITISGYVKDLESKEALIAANIYEPKVQQGTSTNQYGFYSLTLPLTDTLSLIISYVGYKSEAQKIYLQSNIRLDILLAPSKVLDEVEISSSRNNDNVNQTRVGVIDVLIGVNLLREAQMNSACRQRKCASR